MPTAEYQRKWKKKHPGKQTEYMRRWREKHPEKWLAYQRKYTDKNRERVNHHARKWYNKHRDEVNARVRADRKKNPEKYREYDRNRKRDPKLKAKHRRNHYLKHKERIIRECSEYQRKHPEIRSVAMSRRRARLKAGGRHTAVEWLAKIRAFHWRCAYCGKRLTRKKMTKDHVIPLVLGGTDNIANVVPACSPCNHLKHVKVEGWTVREPSTPTIHQ